MQGNQQPGRAERGGGRKPLRFTPYGGYRISCLPAEFRLTGWICGASVPAIMTHMLVSARLLVWLCAWSIGALGFICSGCGEDNSGLPGGAVAKVGDTVIPKAELERRIRESRANAATSAINAVTYDPPGYMACIAGKRKSSGGAKARKAELKQACEDEYEDLEEGALQELIRTQWIRHAADEHGIHVREAAARHAAEEEKDRRFSNEASYRDYLRAAGIREREFVARARFDLLALKVTQKLEQATPAPSDRDIEAYYRSHKAEFRVNRVRAIRVLISKARARAQRGKEALESGESWKSVVRKYSTAPFITRLGGAFIYYEKGQGPIDRHVFGARKGEIVGPVKVYDRDGWEVFQAGDIKPAQHRPLDEVRAQIINALRANAVEQADAAFIKRYRAKTICAPGYRSADCGNRPMEGPSRAGAS
jgi:parvulin-like peptidyl-prolyl isomerase